jgi:hypothetical protein
MMLWKDDEVFDYTKDGNNPLIVSWNIEDDDVEISNVKWNGGNYTVDELWEMDTEMTEDIISYIEDQFLDSEDFWMSKIGYDF